MLSLSALPGSPSCITKEAAVTQIFHNTECKTARIWIATAMLQRNAIPGVIPKSTQGETGGQTCTKSRPVNLSDMRFMTATARSLMTSVASPSCPYASSISRSRASRRGGLGISADPASAKFPAESSASHERRSATRCNHYFKACSI